MRKVRSAKMSESDKICFGRTEDNSNRAASFAEKERGEVEKQTQNEQVPKMATRNFADVPARENVGVDGAEEEEFK